MATYQSMMDKADKISDYYTQLQQDIFNTLTDAATSQRALLNDRNRTAEWRVQCLSKMGALTKDTIKMVAKTTGKTQKAINELVEVDGLSVAKDINSELSDMLDRKVEVSPEIKSIVNSYAKQTFHDINNNVNQTLMSYNYRENPAMKAYQDIINKTVLEAQTGLKTPTRALADNIYKWQSAGLKTGMVDRGGHTWSLEGYTRTVIQSTAHRTFNDVRLQSMKDFDSPLAVMSSHPAARRACAFIQGHVVNVVPMSDKRANPKYDSIYNHGYGQPQGTEGINCRHILYPYVEGVSHNYQEQYDPDEAVTNSQVQQRQRYLERQIRNDKQQIETAKRLKDDEGLAHYKSMLSRHQKALREHVASHDFLTRQPNREKIYGSGKKPVSKITQPKSVKQEPNKTELKSSVKDSDIINAFEKTNIKEAFGDEYYKQFKSSISNLKDEQLRKLYADYGQDLEFANVSKTANDYAHTSTVHLSNSAFEGDKIHEPMETVYHEIGHAIDSTSMNDVFGKQLIPTGRQIKQRLAGKMYTLDEQASHLSGDPSIDLGKTIKQDLFDYINHGEAKSPMQMGKKPRKKAEKAIWLEENSKSWEGVEKVCQFIRDTKPTALENMKKYSNTSDIIEGTGYDVFDYPWNTGHGSKYWKNYGKEETEFFAEYTSSRAANPASLALIKEIFPNAAKICDSLIETMVEAKK